MELHPEVADFLQHLRRLQGFLVQHDEPGWAADVGRAADSVESSDAYGLMRFRQMLGGMGSLNDLLLHRDGRVLTTENDRFAELLAKASDAADELYRSLT